MKKILFLLSFVFASLISFSQGIQSGGFFSRVTDSATYVNSTYVTTSHANNYADIFYSVSSNLFWKWNGSSYELLSSGGGGGDNIYNSDGTLDGNRTVDGDGNTLDFTNLNEFNITTEAGHIFQLEDNTTGLVIDLADEYGVEIQADAGIGIQTLADVSILSVNANDTDGDITVVAEKTSTNTSAQVGRFVRTTSGTAANNIAGYVSLGVENASGVQRDAQLVHQLVDATNASEDSNFKIRGYVAGSLTDLLTVEGSTLLVGGSPVGGLSDGDKGDITVSGSGATWNIDAGVVGATELAAAVNVVGAQDLFLTAPAMWPAVTNGSAPGVTEVSSITYQSLDFDQTTQEFAMLQFQLPRNWNNGTITATPYWTTTASSGSVVWGVSGVALSNDDPFSSSFGTAQTSTDAFILASDLHIAPTTAAITIGGTPADGDLVFLRVSRNPSDGSDTLNGDARLLGVRITITLDAATSE